MTAVKAMALGGNDETLYAYTSTTDSTTGTFTFLTAFASGGFSSANGVLTNTALTDGSTALGFTNDFDIFVYGQGTSFNDRATALSTINTSSNWSYKDGSGDQSNDGTSPDAPFLTDTDSPLVGLSSFTFVWV